MEYKKQIKFWKLRIYIGLSSLTIVWILYFVYNMHSSMSLILWGSFTLYSLFAYLLIPMKKIKDIKEGKSTR